MHQNHQGSGFPRRFSNTFTVISLWTLLCFTGQQLLWADPDLLSRLQTLPEPQTRTLSDISASKVPETRSSDSLDFLSQSAAVIKPTQKAETESVTASASSLISLESAAFAGGRLPDGWQADEGVYTQEPDGSMKLSGNGAWRKISSGLETAQEALSYRIDFSIASTGSWLHVGVDNGDVAGSEGYRRFGFFQNAEGGFTLQVIRGGGVPWEQAKLGVKFTAGVQYTAEFVFGPAGAMELYLYEKGNPRPVQASAVYGGPDFEAVRYTSWIQKGTARIAFTREIPEPGLQGPSFFANGGLPEGWKSDLNYAFESDGGIHLQADGVWKSLSGPLVPVLDQPAVQVDFRTTPSDAGLHLLLDNGLSLGHPDYRRIGIFRGEYLNAGGDGTSKAFVLQIIDSQGRRQSILASVPYIENKDYTLEWVTQTDGTIQLFLYAKGAVRPAQPQGAYTQKDIKEVRYISWLEKGSAVIEGIEMKTAASERKTVVGRLDAGWSGDPGVYEFAKDGSLRLIGNGQWRRISSPLARFEEISSYQMDFSIAGAGSGLHVGVDNGAEPGSEGYRRFGIFQNAEGGFTLQVIRGGGVPREQVKLGVKFKAGVPYTAEFLTQEDGRILLYLYEKGESRPREAAAVYQGPAFSSIRCSSWIQAGSASLSFYRQSLRRTSAENYVSDPMDGRVQADEKGMIRSYDAASGGSVFYETDAVSGKSSLRLSDKKSDGTLRQRKVTEPSAGTAGSEGKIIRLKYTNGWEVLQQDGKAVEWITEAGLRITDVEFAEAGSSSAAPEIESAWIHYPDGHQEFVWNGKVLRVIQADGTLLDFLPSGRLVREIFKADTLHYVYEKGSVSRLLQTRVISEKTGDEVIYDELGILKSVKRSGSTLKYTRISQGSSWVVRLTSPRVPPLNQPKLPVEIQYDANGQMEKMMLADGSRAEFENGRLTSMLDSQGKPTELSYLEADGWIQGVQITRGGSTFVTDNLGALKRMESEQGVMEWVSAPSGGQTQELSLVLPDVGTVQFSSLNENGTIRNGRILTPDGTRQIIENGKVTGFETADGRIYDYRMTQDGSEAQLQSWSLAGGLRIFYQNGQVDEIELADGSRIHHIILDEQKRIASYRKTHAGVDVEYDSEGRARRLISRTLQNGVEINKFEKIEWLRNESDAQKIALIEEPRENIRRIYSESGALEQVIQGDTVLDYESGALQKITTPFGEVHQPVLKAGALDSGEILLKDGTRMKFESGEIREIIRPSGTKVDYENGEISGIHTKNYDYALSSQVTGVGLSDLKIRITTSAGTHTMPLLAYLSDVESAAEETLEEDSENHLPEYHGWSRVDADTFKLGDGAVYLNGERGSLRSGQTGDFIRVREGGDEDFQYRGENFAVEMWVRPDRLGTIQTLWSQYTGGGSNHNMGIHMTEEGKLYAGVEWGGHTLALGSSTRLGTGVWTHVALVRDGTALKLFVNGKLESSKFMDRDMPSGHFEITFGATYSGSGYVYNFKGRLDEIRISKGTSRYSGEFIPFSESFETDPQTKLLYHFSSSPVEEKILEMAPWLSGESDKKRILADAAELREIFLVRPLALPLADLESLTAVASDRAPLPLAIVQPDSENTLSWLVAGSWKPEVQNVSFQNSSTNAGYISGNLYNQSDDLPPDTVRLMDMNGDGWQDRVWVETINQESSTNYWWVQLGQGPGRFLDPIRWTGVNVGTIFAGRSSGGIRSYEGRHPDVLQDLLDMNGDKRPDRILTSIYGESEWWIQYNTGSGFGPLQKVEGKIEKQYSVGSQAAYALEVRNEQGNYELITDLVDITGDGLPDRIYTPSAVSTSGHYDAWMVQRNIWDAESQAPQFSDPVVWTGVDGSLQLTYSSTARQAASLSWYGETGDLFADQADLIDLDGDGLPDRLLLKNINPNDVNSRTEWYWQKNTGAGFAAAELWDSEIRPLTSGWNDRVKTSLRIIKEPGGSRRYLVDLVDVTGDGLPDRVSVDQDQSGANTTWWVEENTGIACSSAESGKVCGFKTAVAWTGIYGADAVETSIGQDGENFRNNPLPISARQVTDLCDLNRDGFLDRVIFSASEKKWRVQYGTGKGFLPVSDLRIEALQAELSSGENEAKPLNTSLFNYLYLRLKSDSESAGTGQVKVTIRHLADWALADFLALLEKKTESEKEALWNSVKTKDDEKKRVIFYQTEEHLLAAPGKDAKDFYIRLDKNGGPADRVEIHYLPANGGPAISNLYAEEMAFSRIRFGEEPEWKDFLLTQEVSVDGGSNSVNREELKHLIESPRSPLDLGIEWAKVMAAETHLTFKTVDGSGGQAFSELQSAVSLDGSTTQFESGNAKKISRPDGTQIILEFPSGLAGNTETRKVQVPGESEETVVSSYGRAREVTKPCAGSENCQTKKLTYSYEFQDGREITKVQDSFTGNIDIYDENRLVRREEPDGVVKKFAYSESGALTETQIFYNDRLEQTIRHSQTADGKAVSITETGVTEEYDSDGRLSAHITPEGFRYEHILEDVRTTASVQTEIQSIDLGQGKTLQVKIPSVILASAPSEETIEVVRLTGYEAENGDRIRYNAHEISEAELADGTRIYWNQTVVFDGGFFTVIYPDGIVMPEEGHVVVSDDRGTFTEFKDGKPWRVKSSESGWMNISREDGGLVDTSEAVAFHEKEALRLWEKVEAVQNQYKLSGAQEVELEMDQDHNLISRRFAEGSVELYEDGKISKVLSSAGEVMTSYEYDDDGHPVKIDMEGARRSLKIETEKIKAQVQKESEEARITVLEKERVLDSRIREEYQEIRKHLEEALRQTQEARDRLGSISVKGKKARNAVNDGYLEIQRAEGQVYGAMAELRVKSDEALKQLHNVEVVKALNDIEKQRAETFSNIDAQNRDSLYAILTQEAMPIVSHEYRKRLGRDPSKEEFYELVGIAEVKKTIIDESTGQIKEQTELEYSSSSLVTKEIQFNYSQFKTYLVSDAFKDEIAERSDEVRMMKNWIQLALRCHYGYASQSDGCPRENTLISDLGLNDSQDLVALRREDVQKISGWIESRTLHFGQSAFLALKELVEAKKTRDFKTPPGGSYGIYPDTLWSQENLTLRLAVQLILTDILTGVLTPLAKEDEDLLISMNAMRQVGSLYGVKLEAMKMNYEGLKALYQKACPAGSAEDCRINAVVHVDGNHYLVLHQIKEIRSEVTGEVIGESVTYTDPGAGKEGALQVMTVSREEFLAKWGSVLAQPEGGRPLSENQTWGFALVEQPAGFETTGSAVLLTTREAMRVRGAFFFLISILIGMIAAAVMATVTAIVAAVTALIAGLMASIGTMLAGIGSFFTGLLSGNILGALGGLLGGIGQGILGIGTAFVNAAVAFQGALVGGLGLEGTFTGGMIGSKALTVGLVGIELRGASSLAEAVGVSPEWVRGAGNLFKAAAGVGLVAIGIPAGVGLVAAASGDFVAEHFDLPPALESVVTVATTALVMGISGLPGGGSLTAAVEALKNAAPDLALQLVGSEIAMAGSALGLDPRLSSLINIPVNASLGGVFHGAGAGIVENFEKALTQNTLGGLAAVGISIGLDKLGLPSYAKDLLGGFMVGLGQTDGGESIFGKLADGVKRFGGWVVSGAKSVFSFGKSILDQAGKVTADSFRAGIHKFSSIFGRETQEEIRADQYGIRSGTVTGDSGHMIWTSRDGEDQIVYDRNSDTVTEIFGEASSTAMTGVEIDDAGRVHVARVDHQTITSDGTLHQIFSEDEAERWAWTGKSGEEIQVDVTQSDVLNPGNLKEGQISIKIPAPSEDPSTSPNPIDYDTTITVPIRDGNGSNLKIEKNTTVNTSGPGTVASTEPFYVLSNGINNENKNLWNLLFGQDVTPDYFQTLEADLIKKSSQPLDASEVVVPSTYFSSLILRALGNAGNRAKDVLWWLAESQDPYHEFGIVQDIKSGIEDFYAERAKIGENAVGRPVVGVGYSGGFAPLVETLNKMNIQTSGLVGAGAAISDITEVRETLELFGNALEYVQRNALEPVSGLLQKFFELFGKIGDLASRTIKSFFDKIAQLFEPGALLTDAVWGKLTDAIARAFEETGIQAKMRDLPLGLANLASKDAVFVNVYGDRDVLNVLNVGGYRDQVSSFSTASRNLINIEVMSLTDPRSGKTANADHYIYFGKTRDYDEIKDPIQRALQSEYDSLVNDFMTRLILANDSKKSLADFFNAFKSFLVEVSPGHYKYYPLGKPQQ